MTGFGRAEQKTKLGRISIEITSVNNRFLEFSFRSPRNLSSLDMRIRDLLSEKIARGKITVLIGVEETDDSANGYPVSKRAVAAYYKRLKKIQKELSIPGEVTISDILQLPDVLATDQQLPSVDANWRILKPILTRARDELVRMRKREGAALGKDMRPRLTKLKAMTQKIEQRSPVVLKAFRKKLTDRIADLTETPKVNSVRLEEEIAYIAERTDITEECTRFGSHITEYRRTLSLKKPVGKRLNFLLQEMNREVNTIGSKCSDASITSIVIALKEEIEKLREQVQNVE
jgi:uncharacterized protein (TIGR00255 family)